jgi:hypothetical protein
MVCHQLSGAVTALLRGRQLDASASRVRSSSSPAASHHLGCEPRRHGRAFRTSVVTAGSERPSALSSRRATVVSPCDRRRFPKPRRRRDPPHLALTGERTLLGALRAEAEFPDERVASLSEAPSPPWRAAQVRSTPALRPAFRCHDETRRRRAPRHHGAGRSAGTSSSSGRRRAPSTPGLVGYQRGRPCACRTCGADRGSATELHTPPRR